MTEPTPPEISPPSRRDFLKSSTAATIGLGLLSNAHAAGSDTIKVGLIGCGGRGTRRSREHLRGRRDHLQHQAPRHGRRVPRPPQELPRAPAEQRQLQGEVRRRRRPLLRRLRRLSEGDRLLRPGDAGDPAGLPAPAHRGRPSRPASTSSPRSRSPSMAPASARCWPPTRRPRRRASRVVAGTQRRHQAGYLESMKRIHDGAIGDLITGPRLLEPGRHLGQQAPGRAGATPSTSSATGTTSSGSAATTSSSSTCTTWTSPSGRMGAHPVRAVGMGGRQVHTEPELRPELRPLRGRLRVPQRRPRPEHVPGRSRAAPTTSPRRSSAPRGPWTAATYRFTGATADRIRVEHEVNPYVQEHIDLLESITTHKPINELKQVAESTLTAIMGRDVGLHRQGRLAGSRRSTPSSTPSPESRWLWGPMKEAAVPRPARTS